MYRLALSLALMLTANTLAVARDSSLIIRGTGIVAVAPDVATVSVSLRTRNKDPLKTQADHVEATRKMMKAMEALGIGSADMGATRFTFRRDAREGEVGEIVELGYYAENSVEIRTKNFEVLPKIIATAVSNGATRVDDISYNIADREPHIDKARALAFADAKEGAEKSATAAGYKLGSIIKISAGDAYIPADLSSNYYGGGADAPVSSLEPLLTPGVIEVQYTVNIEYALE